jgi:parvulin-like peptidyl-prolyl isomerase
MAAGWQPAVARAVRALLAVIVPLVGVFASCAAHSALSAEPKAVARVNGEVITERDVHRVLGDPAIRLQLLQGDPGFRVPNATTLNRLAIQKLIEHRLLLQEARRRNIEVSEKELDQAVVDLRRRFKDLKDLGIWMKVHEVDDRSLLDVIRDELLIKHAAEALVKDVRVSEQEIQAYYEAHKEELRAPGQFRLQIIAVESKEVAQQLLMDVYSGADFGQLARARSRGERAAQGGDTGWVSWKDIPTPLRDVVRGLKIGQIGGPVGSGTDYRLVRLTGHRPGPTKTLAEVRPEVQRRALEAKRKRVYQEWRADQEQKSKVEWLI